MGMQKTIKIDVNVPQKLWPYRVMNEIQRVMEEGEAKSKSGWDEMPVVYHAERAQEHLNALIGDNEQREDHLAHAFCRLMMAIAIERGYVQKGDTDA